MTQWAVSERRTRVLSELLTAIPQVVCFAHNGLSCACPQDAPGSDSLFRRQPHQGTLAVGY